MSSRRDGGAKIVYSTSGGRVCPTCGWPVDDCKCSGRRRGDSGSGSAASDGILRIRRETKGRGGKTVTTVSGIPPDAGDLRDLARQLKRRCGTGGTVKQDGVIEIQGDHRQTILDELEKRGFTVKLAGG